MVESIITFIAGEQKAEQILANSFIEMIFFILFSLFVVSICVHFIVFTKLRHIRNSPNFMDVEPISRFKDQFTEGDQLNVIKAETFVQKQFSEWRLLGIPVVNLIKMTHMMVSVFILIGVLGTFIGLTIALGSIDAGGDQLVENVAAVLAGVDVAFYTSIVGMTFSLIMTLLIKVFNTEYLLTDMMLRVESELESGTESGINDLINVSERIEASIVDLNTSNQQALGEIVSAFSGFKEYTTGLQQSAKDLAQFNDGLTRNLEEFEALFQRMKEVTDGFSEGTKALNHNFASLFSYFKKTDAKNERMTQAFENIQDKAEDTAQVQKETLERFQTTATGLQAFMSSIVDNQTAVKGSFEQIHKETQTLVNQMSSHTKTLQQALGNDVTTQLRGVVLNLEAVKRGFEYLSPALNKLPDTLAAINQTQDDYRHLLGERFEELKTFNRSLADHLEAYGNQTRAFENKYEQATQSNEQFVRHSQQLIQQINDIMTALNETFSRRENDVNSSLFALKTTMSKFPEQMEDVLTKQMNSVMRGLTESVDQLTGEMRREFKQLQRATEEAQTANTRYMQQLLQELIQEVQLFNESFKANRNGEARLGLNEGRGRYDD
ncbi:MotA/TolQ/ExbB proton channel family protein [Lentibacillus saliphilus]|uniref:MotA/TolQ/ExbB proton channel family protein n=1 Tax=Lentibacillus saliphilus TaxID=2737028 RepID=UPI001C30D67E|nr:MotA/TolQ/ExbB proton channel family protein [Lentibacillus saliphilus]